MLFLLVELLIMFLLVVEFLRSLLVVDTSLLFLSTCKEANKYHKIHKACLLKALVLVVL
jgi:hypothetical protein